MAFENMTIKQYNEIEDSQERREAYAALRDPNGVWFSGIKINPARHKDEIIDYLDWRYNQATELLKKAQQLQADGVNVNTAIRQLIGSDAEYHDDYSDFFIWLSGKIDDVKRSELAIAIDWPGGCNDCGAASAIPNTGFCNNCTKERQS